MTKVRSTAANYRPDIDGIRAVAVASVVIYHAVPSILPGGFLGVDIFFVISGFLIGTIILERLNSGISPTAFFVEFYTRRAKRILPALAGVVLATIIIGLFLLTSEELKSLGTTATTAMIGFSNIYFWLRKDYFGPDSDQLPMLMTWSLGVEEQFYLAAPIIMILIHKFRPKIMMISLTAILLVSFSLSLWISDRSPTFAFYMLPTRAWELASGVLLAAWTLKRSDQNDPVWAPTLASLAGISLISAALVFANEEMNIPGFVSSLPVLGTVLLIYSRRSWSNRHILAYAPLVQVGLLSYSWYLWHWPILAFLRIATPVEPAVPVLLCAAAMSGVAGYFSWRFVELPFRHRREEPSHRSMVQLGAIVGVLAVGLGAIRSTDGIPARLSPEAHTVQSVIERGRGNCLLPDGETTLTDNAECRPIGDAGAIALIGDSHASALGPGLSDFASDRGKRLIQMSKSGCPPITAHGPNAIRPSNLSRECAVFVEAALKYAEGDPSIETVVVAGAWPSLDAEGVQGFRAGIVRVVDRLNAAGKHVVLVGDVPAFLIDPTRVELAAAIPLRGALASLSGPIEGSRMQAAEPEPTANGLLENLAMSAGTATYVPLRSTFCSSVCAYADERGLLFIDTHHLSTIGSRAIRWPELGRPSGVALRNPHAER